MGIRGAPFTGSRQRRAHPVRPGLRAGVGDWSHFTFNIFRRFWKDNFLRMEKGTEEKEEGGREEGNYLNQREIKIHGLLSCKKTPEFSFDNNCKANYILIY